jgi:hypothetical protein
MVEVSDLHDISEIVIATQRENYKRINNQNSRLLFLVAYLMSCIERGICMQIVNSQHLDRLSYSCNLRAQTLPWLNCAAGEEIRCFSPASHGPILARGSRSSSHIGQGIFVQSRAAAS